MANTLASRSTFVDCRLLNNLAFRSFQISQQAAAKQRSKEPRDSPDKEVLSSLHLVGMSPESVIMCLLPFIIRRRSSIHKALAKGRSRRMCSKVSTLSKHRTHMDGPYYPRFARLSAIKILFLAASQRNNLTWRGTLEFQTKLILSSLTPLSARKE